ncbi:MAG: hypothetical protein KJP07_00190 [Desulfatitalea sp.]|nr:hypothetical protein [Desulfatitalea sp.]
MIFFDFLKEEQMLETPILFLVFNRPDITQRVFHQIRKARPCRLFVAADGPRVGVASDQEQCSRVRSLFSDIDWDCELLTLFRDQNLGCKKAVSSAIDWFFSIVDAGIILEDDCLPEYSFFSFCNELLTLYQDDDKIMMISGGNYQMGHSRSPYSYYFSHYTHVWGWATWADRWRLYDVSMKEWETLNKIEFLKQHVADRNELRFWLIIFEQVFHGKIDTWDFQLLFTCWMNSRLSVIPNVNLISNIGFDVSATHTKRSSPFADIPVFPINLPLRHPDIVQRHIEADKFTSTMQYKMTMLKKFLYVLRLYVSKNR